MTGIYKFTFSGTVIKSIGRGRKLGYPTANVAVGENLPEGIFAGDAIIADKKFPSLVFIGVAETFGETDKKAEVHILDYNQDLYGQEITVTILEKLRDGRKFESQADLIEAMKQDEKAARDFFFNR